MVIPLNAIHLVETALGAPYHACTRVLQEDQRWRRVDYFEILVVTEGGLRLEVRTGSGRPTVTRIPTGSLLMFRPQDDSQLGAVDASGVTVRYVSFPAADWHIFAALSRLSSRWAASDRPIAARLDRADDHVLEAFDAAIGRFSTGATGFDLLQFWVTVVPKLVSMAERGPDTPPEWLVAGLEAMDDEANLRTGLPRLTQLCRVGTSYLASSTRRYLGVTPTTLVTELRLRHAARLLATTTASVEDIGRRCGFANRSYFSASFVKVLGVSPRGYRQRAYAAPRDERPPTRPLGTSIS